MNLKQTIWLLVVTVMVWGGYWLVAAFVVSDWAKSGQFGDTFGALNTLFTGCAFVVVLATLIQQSRQIAETKHDLEEERRLQKRTAELVAEQAEALTLQARLHALTARIEAYQFQLKEATDCGNFSVAEGLRKELHELLLKLDQVLRSHGD